jgi:hypothetical protein
MPDAKDNAKMTGDTHLPDVESDDLPAQEGETGVGVEGTPGGRRRPGDGRTGRGISKAGVLKDKVAEASNSIGNTQGSGEGSDGG